jgi:uncharacterized RDD family membrane protein YckC
MHFLIRGDDGEEYGPVDLAELRNWVRENRAGLGTMVRVDAPEGTWQPWHHYPDLVALLAEVRAGANPLGGSVLAPVGRRMVALGADLVLICVLLYLICFILYFLCSPEIQALLLSGFSHGYYTPPQLPPGYESIIDLISYGVVTLYMAGFQAAHGRTPGKSILRIRVVDQTGAKPRPGPALLRALVLTFSISLFFFPLLYVFFHPQRRALHDLIAGTYVVEN